VKAGTIKISEEAFHFFYRAPIEALRKTNLAALVLGRLGQIVESMYLFLIANIDDLDRSVPEDTEKSSRMHGPWSMDDYCSHHDIPFWAAAQDINKLSLIFIIQIAIGKFLRRSSAGPEKVCRFVRDRYPRDLISIVVIEILRNKRAR
jgi:hypothetical protein